MTGDDSTIRRCIRKLTLLRSPSAKLKKTLARKVTLEKVLGLTTAGNSTLTCDPCSGVVAYPAGCVVVLLSPETSTQRHIINTSTKSITALSFSPDGKYLVTGESGHLPAVRVWDVAECRQVAELQRHKYGISCVCFSPDGKSIVSVGNQHDMMVYVWTWKRDVVVAANKVSSKVTAVAFSQDSSYLVTAGNRHVKFWYLDHCKTAKSSAPVPLLGHAGLLGELKNNFFCDVACGRGSTSDSTFCITSSGLLCVFTGRRTLDKWVDLRTSAAQSLAVCEDLVFCGCADGTVRVFSTADLRFVCTLPHPYMLGTDVTAKHAASMLPLLHTPPGTSLTATTHPTSHLSSAKMAAGYPDTVAVTYDLANHWLSCVYSDHSLYVWDVQDIHKVATVHSALFHSASIWDLQVCPEVPGESDGGLFFSCSADNTIRLWSMEGQGQSHIHTHNSIISDDLLNVIHKDGYSAAALQGSSSTATERAAVDGQTAENRAGIRTMCVSPDSKHLASGDRSGILRIHDLRSMEEVLRVHAHATEILCLEYSKPETGVKLLATAGRDRLVHVLDADHDYALLQTLDEHSASITAIRFAATDNQVKMISCGADKSVYFHTSTRTEKGMEFLRCHHVVLKTTPHDMAIDPTGKYAAIGCQDRCIRVFNISSGKQKKLYKGSLNEDGSLLKVQMDPSGRYVATICSDKNISIVDVDTGECVATMFGHSELVTGVKFTNDCKRLISVSADSCVMVWRLAPDLTINMTERLRQLRQTPCAKVYKSSSLRREVKSAPCLGEVIDALRVPDVAKRRRRLWSLRKEPLDLTVQSMIDLRQLETLSPTQDHPAAAAPLQHEDAKRNDKSAILQSRREVNGAPCPGEVSSGGERVEDTAERIGDPGDLEEIPTHVYSDSSKGDEDTPCSVEPVAKVGSIILPAPDVAIKRARRHWSRCRESMKLTVKSMVDLRQLENPESPLQDRDSGSSDLEEIPTDIYSESSQGDEEDTACPAAPETTKVGSVILPDPDVAIKRARRHWSRGRESMKLTVKSMVDLRQLENPESPLQDRDSGTSCNLQDSKQMEKSQKHQGCSPADCVSSHASKTSKETDRDLLPCHGNEDNSDPGKDCHPGSLQARVDPNSPDSACSLFYDSRESSPLAIRDSEDMLPLSPQDSSDGEREEGEEREVDVVKSMDEALRSIRDCGQEDVFKQNFEMLTDDSGIMDEQNATPTLSLSARYLAAGCHDRRRPPVSKAHDQDAGSHSARPPVSKVRPLVKKNSTYYGSIVETNPQNRETGHGEREPGSGMQRGPATVPRNPTRTRCPASEPSTTGAGSPDRDPVPPSLPQKKRPLGPGRLSNPPSSSRNPLTVVKATGLRKSQSVLSLTTNSLRSTAPSADRREALRQRRPQSFDSPPRAASSSSSPQTSPRLASSRHSLYLKGTARCDVWSAGGQVRVSPPGNRKALEKRLSLPSPLPVRLNNRAVSESVKDRPLVPAQRLTLTANPQQDVSVNMEACRQAAAQLHDSLKRAATLYTKVLSCGAEPSLEQQHMRTILWEALGSMRSKMDSLPCPSPLSSHPADLGVHGGGDGGPPGGSVIAPCPPSSPPGDLGDGDGERTLVLLEKYSELLLKSVEKRLENKT